MPLPFGTCQDSLQQAEPGHPQPHPQQESYLAPCLLEAVGAGGAGSASSFWEDGVCGVGWTPRLGCPPSGASLGLCTHSAQGRRLFSKEVLCPFSS